MTDTAALRALLAAALPVNDDQATLIASVNARAAIVDALPDLLDKADALAALVAAATRNGPCWGCRRLIEPLHGHADGCLIAAARRLVEGS